MSRLFAIAFAVVLACMNAAGAQNYPSHTITMVVPFPAGGGMSLLGHILAEQLKTELGQTQVKALAVMAKRRWIGAPEVPTVDETGFPGIYVSFWHGLWAPKGTPKDVIARLNGAVVKALADATVQKRFIEQGQEMPPRDQQTPEALYAYQKADIEKWWPIIKAAGIKAQ